MKIFITVCLLFTFVESVRNFDKDEEEQWKIFKAAFSKTYPSTRDDRDKMSTYFRNTDFIFRYNQEYLKEHVSQILRINQFGDLIPKEFRKFYNGFNRSHISLQSFGQLYKAPHNVTIPDSIDWRKKLPISEIKDQGSCKADWAFSVAGAIESHLYLKNKTRNQISVQNIIDCSHSNGNDGCNSGSMAAAYKYINENGGIMNAGSYPFKGVKGRQCKFNKANKTNIVNVPGFFSIPYGSETDLKAAVGLIGPVSAAIDGGHLSFQFYENGVYYEPTCQRNRPDRGVLIVGYDTSPNGEDYWIIKNSLGLTWGNKGYMNLARNKHNHCGIASAASFPLL